MSTRVKAEFMRDGRLRLLVPFHEVPRGFITDGASIPRFFWRVLGHPYDGRVIRAAVRHDWAYSTGSVPRAVADREFYDNLCRDGNGWLRARLFFLGVRLFGRRHYNHKEG